MNRRKLTGVIASLVVAALGTFIILNYVNSSEKKSTPLAVQTVPVLKVVKSIPKGTPADKLGDAVAVSQIPATDKLADSAVTVEELAGLVASADMVQGEQVVKTRFVPAQQVQKEAAGASSGLIGVWISIDPIRALAGRISVGNEVAVFASFKDVGAAQADPTAVVPTSHLIIHKAPVLDVIGAIEPPVPTPGKDAAAAPPVAAVAQLQVKLGVDAPEAERLVFAATNGQLWLGDEPTDVIESGTKIVERGNIYTATPKQVPAAPALLGGPAVVDTTTTTAAPAPAPTAAPKPGAKPAAKPAAKPVAGAKPTPTAVPPTIPPAAAGTATTTTVKK